MKTVSIIGSCNSRELFNYDFIKKEFQIDLYAFQTNLWDMFSAPLGLDEKIIYQAPMEQFLRRMLDWDINKRIISNLLEKKSEYLVIDFFIMTKNVLKIKKDDRCVYINHVSGRKVYDYINTLNIEGLSAEVRPLKSIDENIILDGLNRLACFAKENYKPENIIVVNPVFNLKYLDKNNNIVSYNDDEIAIIIEEQKTMDYYTDYFVNLIPGCKKLIPHLTVDYACFRMSDFDMKKPTYTHHPKHEEMNYAYQLYNLVFNEECSVPRFDTLVKEYDVLSNYAYELSNTVNRFTRETLTSLNNYFYNILDLNRYIVAIAARDEASRCLYKFIAKNKLELSFPNTFRQSYIGIVDKGGDYYFEQSSDNALEKEYVVRKNIIKINSAGYLCGNNSSILVNGVEYSLNKRGLNFVIIDNQTFEVVNQFCCDVHADENLLISLKPKY